MKQAAVLLVTAVWLQHAMNSLWLQSGQPLPELQLIVQGGPGTGNTQTVNLCKDLVLPFLRSAAAQQCAFMHSAARLVHGETLHGALAVPVGEATGSSKTFGTRKEELQHKWADTNLDLP